jgi:DNA helicase IV
LSEFLVQTTAEEPGRVVVIVPDQQLDSWNELLTSAEFGRGETAVDARIAVLPVRDTKGLEFDIVFVIDPEVISRQAPHGADIYVACTRATRDLHLVTIED